MGCLIKIKLRQKYSKAEEPETLTAETMVPETSEITETPESPESPESPEPVSDESKFPSLHFIYTHLPFFSNCKIIEKGFENKKFYVKIYVVWSENKVSEFIHNVLVYDRKISKIEVLS